MDPLGLNSLYAYSPMNPNASAVNSAWIRLGNPAAGNALAHHQAMLVTLLNLLVAASSMATPAGVTPPSNAAASASSTASGLAGQTATPSGPGPSWAPPGPAPFSAAPAGRPSAFKFSCKPISPSQVPGLVARNTLIGVDPNYEGSQTTIDAVKRAGGRLHVYREGPGGATGSTGWDPEELGRSRAAASKYGGMKGFMAGGWRQHTLEQLKQDKLKGFESAEVDNIPESQLIPFYREYAAEFRKGTLPKLMMKNLSAEQVRAVQAAGLPRDMFADFAIWESSGGSGSASAGLLSQMGIKQLTSTDTYNYSASG